MRRLPAADAARRLPTAIATLGRELASRWVITFALDEYRGSSQPIGSELSARAPDGRFGRAAIEGIKIPLVCD